MVIFHTFFLSAGIRLSELININLKDINIENNCITILGKITKKEQSILITIVNYFWKNTLK